MKKIKYTLLLLLLVPIFAYAGLELLAPVEGKWVQTGSLVPGQAYAIAFFDVAWQERLFTAHEGITEKWVNAFNMNPVTKPPVYLYSCKEGIISPIDSPWKWVPDSI
ncbi:MAG: hypothetical protein ACXABY_30110 [Candidatus Thorarchaeota archaeon]